MSPLWDRSDKRLEKGITHFCKGIAGSCEITALAVLNDYATGLQDTLRALAVVKNFQPRLINRVVSLAGRTILFSAVDKWWFERDVDRGFLGEVLAQNLFFPYLPLINRHYLRVQEVKLKKRLVLQLLENLVLDFPEMSYNLRIKPEYFMYQNLWGRLPLFPSSEAVSNFLEGKFQERKVQGVMTGYVEALKELEKENFVDFSGGYVRIDRGFAEKVKGKKPSLQNLLKTTHRFFFNSLFTIFLKALVFLSPKIATSPAKRRNKPPEITSRLENPLNYLHIPTGEGVIPLSNKMAVEIFVSSLFPVSGKAEIEVEKMGGILNEVRLLQIRMGEKERKFVTKRFKGWSSLKWIPLHLWALGTTDFAIFPRSRLERECTVNQILHSEGLNVPKILHVNHGQRLLFREYIQGEQLNHRLSTLLDLESGDALADLSQIMGNIGGIFAEVHSLGIALGDTKPENILIGEKTGKVYLVDMEQASRTGDRRWDIAEFLYYSGHYLPPLAGISAAKIMAQSFITGYLQAGGDPTLIKKAGSFQYAKVFIPFTFPHLILTISHICKEADKVTNPSEKNPQKKGKQASPNIFEIRGLRRGVPWNYRYLSDLRGVSLFKG